MKRSKQTRYTPAGQTDLDSEASCLPRAWWFATATLAATVVGSPFGGDRKVYFGTLKDGTEVAVKCMRRNSEKNGSETEVERIPV